MHLKPMRFFLVGSLLAPLCGALAPFGKASPAAPPGEIATATPESQGVDAGRLASAYSRAGALRPLLSLLVLKNGVMVGEQYFHGATRESAFNIKSVSKSILAALTGVALTEGFIQSLDQPISSFFSEHFPPVDASEIGWAQARARTDPEKRKINTRHLLTHTSGLVWDENQLLFSAWLWSSDYVRFVLELPIQAQDEKFVYSTGGTHLLSALLARASGMDTRAFAERYLFDPAGMEVKRWDRAPEGTYIGGAEMHFTARDMAKFGLLHLQGGRLWGKQILPEAWVKESTAEHVKANYATAREGQNLESWIWKYLEPGKFTGYGYLWWRRESAGFETWVALGYGGQFIFVIPELDALLVATSAWDQQTNPDRMAHYADFFAIVDGDIVPALRPGGKPSGD